MEAGKLDRSHGYIGVAALIITVSFCAIGVITCSALTVPAAGLVCCGLPLSVDAFRYQPGSSLVQTAVSRSIQRLIHHRGLSIRLSQPLVVARRTFNFMNRSKMLATLAATSGGSGPSR